MHAPVHACTVTKKLNLFFLITQRLHLILIHLIGHISKYGYGYVG